MLRQRGCVDAAVVAEPVQALQLKRAGPQTSALQVAERSLFLWNNEYIVSLVAQHRQVILPVVFSALESNARSHWNPAVHGLTCNVRKMFEDMDEQLYEDCRGRYEEEEVGAGLCPSLSEMGCWLAVGQENPCGAQGS